MKLHNSHTIKKEQTGFTILELLIATSILSIILLLVSTILISIGSLYQKGVNNSTAQDNARNIIDQISQLIEFSPASYPVSYTPYVTGTTYGDICIDGYRGTFITDTEKINGDAEVFYLESKPNELGSGSPSCDVGLKVTYMHKSDLESLYPGEELVARNASLQYFNVTKAGNGTYLIQVAIAMGDPSDLIASTRNTAAPACISGVGQQYCATASLSTVVAPRL